MGLRVVGWGCQDDEMCAFCDKNKATIYVEDTQDRCMEMIPACNTCVPPQSCPDPIADVFARVIAKAQATQ